MLEEASSTTMLADPEVCFLTAAAAATPAAPAPEWKRSSGKGKCIQ
jgi:hypothetical protein